MIRQRLWKAADAVLFVCSLQLGASSAAKSASFTTFDPPGSIGAARTAPAINPAGAITGSYADASGAHGFLRAANGTITTFDPPGSLGTVPTAINPAGAITGSYSSSPRAPRDVIGFLRAADGTVTTFELFSFTVPTAINPAVAITGNYYKSGGTPHGFLRTSDGTITGVDPPGSTGSMATGINSAGVITGVYCVGPGGGGPCHGFLRTP